MDSGDFSLDDLYISYTKPYGLDDDSDGLTNEYEISLGLNPNSNDSDLDGVSDLPELLLGKNPLLTDISYERLHISDAQSNWFCDFSENMGFRPGSINAQKGWESNSSAVINEEKLILDVQPEGFSQVEKTFISNPAGKIWIGFDALLSKSICPESFNENCVLAISVNQEGVLCYFDGVSNSWVETSFSGFNGEKSLE